MWQTSYVVIRTRNVEAERIGRWIKANRVQHGWSQTQLTRKMRTHPHVTSVSDWERGENVPSGPHLTELARVFGELPPSDDEEESELSSALAIHVDGDGFLRLGSKR